VVLGVPGRLRSRIFSTFGTTRVVSRLPNAPAPFTPGEIPGTHFQRLSRSQGTWFCRKEPLKKSQVTPPGIDPGTVRLVAQRFGEQYITLSFSLCSFLHSPVTSSLLGPNILLSTLFSNTLSLRVKYSFSVTLQQFQQINTTQILAI